MKINKPWLFLNEAADLISKDKSKITVREILFLIFEHNLRAYCVLKTVTQADCYRLQWDYDENNNIVANRKRCGYNVFTTFMPLDSQDIYKLAAKGIYEKVNVREFDNDPLEGFDDREDHTSWMLREPLIINTEDVVVLSDDFLACVEKDNYKSLVGKERETLLVIIAALAKEANIDITKTSKAGEIIASMTQQLGASIGATTIETHLKKISQALGNRAK